MRKLVYICSPYGGKEENYQKAQEYMRDAIQRGVTPIASHVLYHGVLDDKSPAQRIEGMGMALMLLGLCDEVWVFGEAITDGMKLELAEANKLGIPVRPEWIPVFEYQMEGQNG